VAPLRRNVEESVRWTWARTKPETVAAVLKDIYKVGGMRREVWLRIMFKLNDTVRVILDKYGIAGFNRTMYYDYTKSLWKWLKKYPESVWPQFIEFEFRRYADFHRLDEAVLKDLTDATVEVIREILEKGVEVPRGVEGAEGGGAGEAVGEGGGGGEAGGGEGGGPVHEGAGQRGGGDEVPEVRGGVQGVRGGGVGA
jgi:hypothetical protein